MCLEATTLTTTNREVQRMKITRCSESCGGSTLPRGRGSRFARRGSCPPNWLPCQVNVIMQLWCFIFNSLQFSIFELFKDGCVLKPHVSSKKSPFLDYSTIWTIFCHTAVLHGNNLLVFGGTGIPFGENNGNDVHVCNVKYKRWSLLNCRGKKPNRIYGQVESNILWSLKIVF